MFQKKSQPPTTHIKLPKLPGSPGFDDVQFLLIEAQRSRGRTVEMPWTNEDRTAQFMLSARVEMDGGEPAWILYRGEAEANRLTWSYASGDVNLIFNLVLSECVGKGGLQHQDMGNSYAGAPERAQDATMSITLPTQSYSSGNYGTATAKPKAKATLEGTLTNMQPPNLLQSIAIAKMTGKLVVQSDVDMAEIFFDDGVPAHAVTRESTGTDAVIDLMLWEQGEFHFYPDERTNQKTVTKRLDMMIMEGVTLLDQHRYLMSQNVRMDSFCMRKHASLSEAEFEKAITSRGAPIDLLLQKLFYQSVDNKSTLFELLRKRPMPKTEWIPLMFNMLTCELLKVTDEGPRVNKMAPLEAMGIDRAAIQGVMKALNRPETGIFTYPSLLYFFEQEMFRYEANALPFSVLIIEARVRSGPDAQPEPLQIPAVRELARRVNTLKRNLDIFGHWETFDYAMLLPNTTTPAAQVMAHGIAEQLLKTPLTSDLDPRALTLSIGLGCVPEDCQDLGLVLSAAFQAKNRAKQTNSVIVLFRDLKNG